MSKCIMIMFAYEKLEIKFRMFQIVFFDINIFNKCCFWNSVMDDRNIKQM